MSRTTRVAAVALAMLTAIGTAGAQTSFSVAAGASVPTGNWGDFHDVGYHVLGGIGFTPPLSPIGFRFEGAFNEFNRTNLGSDAKDRILSLAANALIGFGTFLGPYAIGGVGVYNIRQPNGLNDQTEFGFNIGAGYRFGLTGFSAFAEARYTRAADGVSYVPITFGVTF